MDSPLDELLRAGSLNVDKTKSVAAQAASRQATDPEQEIKRLKKQMKARLRRSWSSSVQRRSGTSSGSFRPWSWA